MTGQQFVLDALGPVAGAIAFLAVGLLGLALLHMIGKTN